MTSPAIAPERPQMPRPYFWQGNRPRDPKRSATAKRRTIERRQARKANQ